MCQPGEYALSKLKTVEPGVIGGIGGDGGGDGGQCSTVGRGHSANPEAVPVDCPSQQVRTGDRRQHRRMWGQGGGGRQQRQVGRPQQHKLGGTQASVQA